MPFDSPDAPNRHAPQITLEVQHHPAVEAMLERGEHVYLTGTLHLKLEVPVLRDLNSGDLVHVTIVNADGEPLANAHAEVESVGFEPIRVKDVGIIGEDRIHKAKLTEAQPAPPADA